MNQSNDPPQVIQGGLPDGQSFACAGDLVVEGNVGACRIECGGNLTVEGGILGRASGVIYVAGALSARFLSRVRIEAGGDICAISEINECYLTAAGKVLATTGTIAGGRIQARTGVEADVLGAESGEETTIVPGCADYAAQALVDLKKKRAAALANGERIRQTILPHLKDITKLNTAQKTALQKLDERLRELEAAREQWDREIKRIGSGTPGVASQNVIVRVALFPGVLLDFGEEQKKIREAVAGPVRVWYNAQMGQVKVAQIRDSAPVASQRPDPDAEA